MACRTVGGLSCGQEALEAEVTLGKGGQGWTLVFSRPGPPRPAAFRVPWEWVRSSWEAADAAVRAGWRRNAEGRGATGLLWASLLMSCEKPAHLEPR